MKLKRTDNFQEFEAVEIEKRSMVFFKLRPIMPLFFSKELNDKWDEKMKIYESKVIG